MDPIDPPSPDAPDPLRDLAFALHTDASHAALGELDPAALARLTAIAVAEGRASPSSDWLERLEALRGRLLLGNHRAAYGLCLAGLADVAGAIGEVEAQLRALDKLVGLRDLMREPARAHDAILLLARAQQRGGRLAEAEATLLKAVERAQRLAPGGHLAEASARTADSLIRLGTLLAGQGRTEEARAWLEGAVEIAGDPELAQAAKAALAAL